MTVNTTVIELGRDGQHELLVVELEDDDEDEADPAEDEEVEETAEEDAELLLDELLDDELDDETDDAEDKLLDELADGQLQQKNCGGHGRLSHLAIRVTGNPWR